MTTIQKVKEMLKQNSGWGMYTDKWGEVMNLFFDVVSHCYEKGDCNPTWQFRPSIFGNIIDEESYNFEELNNMDYEDLFEAGNYLHRVSTLLEKAGLSY